MNYSTAYAVVKPESENNYRHVFEALPQSPINFRRGIARTRHASSVNRNKENDTDELRKVLVTSSLIYLY